MPFILFDTVFLNPGSRIVTAVARDAAGNTAVSAPVSFIKGNQTAPQTPGSSLSTLVTSYSPGSLVTGGYSGWVGARIKIGSSSITISELGRYTLAGNKRSHVLKLVDASTGADVESSTVQISLSGRPAGQFTYGALASPITLEAGKTYYLVSSEDVLVSGGDAFQEYNGVIRTTSHAAIQNAVFLGQNPVETVGLRQSVRRPGQLPVFHSVTPPVTARIEN